MLCPLTNVCGDGFVNPGVESCDLLPTSSVTCATLGFADGTVQCASDCTFDTSGCTGTSAPTATPTPTPEVTPSGGVETATPTSGESPGTPTPTVTSTPGGGGATCESGDTVVVTASLDKAFAAFAMTLAYPTGTVNLPGSGQSLANRVAFDVSGGLSTASDDDDIGGDGVDDTLHASFVSNVANDPGDVFTVTFDCIPGQAKPVTGAFTCTVVSASTPEAETIPDEVCTLVVQ